MVLAGYNCLEELTAPSKNKTKKKQNKNKKKHQALVTSTVTVGGGQAEPWPGWFHPHLSYHRQCLHVANVGQHGQRLAADLCVPREF